MGVNLSVEVYLFDNVGCIKGDDVLFGYVKCDCVDFVLV